MALRGKRPTLIQKRLKAFFFGPAGVGKSTACTMFPKPYIIDTERGMENDQYVKRIDDRGGVIFQTADCDEILAEVKALLTEKHDYKTLVIDPFTTVYNNLVDAAEMKVGGEYGRHIAQANKFVKRLNNLLMRLDMNVIITSHAKDKYGSNMVVLEQTFDCYKKMDYLFDLVLEIQKRGKERYGVVRKSRIQSFEEMESFVFSYDAIADKYGREILEKDAVVQEMATLEQVSELYHLVDVLKIEAPTIAKWLEKTNSSCFEEMSRKDINTCIQHLNQKINRGNSTQGELPNTQPKKGPNQ